MGELKNSVSAGRNKFGFLQRGGTGEAVQIARPSTAVRPAGYTKSKMFDPLNQSVKRAVVVEAHKEET